MQCIHGNNWFFFILTISIQLLYYKIYTPVQSLGELHEGGNSLAKLIALLLLSMLFPAFLLATAANVSSRLIDCCSMLAGRLGSLTDIGFVGEVLDGASVLLEFTWLVLSTVLALASALLAGMTQKCSAIYPERVFSVKLCFIYLSYLHTSCRISVCKYFYLHFHYNQHFYF